MRTASSRRGISPGGVAAWFHPAAIHPRRTWYWPGTVSITASHRAHARITTHFRPPIHPAEVGAGPCLAGVEYRLSAPSLCLAMAERGMSTTPEKGARILARTLSATRAWHHGLAVKLRLKPTRKTECSLASRSLSQSPATRGLDSSADHENLLQRHYVTPWRCLGKVPLGDVEELQGEILHRRQVELHLRCHFVVEIHRRNCRRKTGRGCDERLGDAGRDH